jgi:hypothetical protein
MGKNIDPGIYYRTTIHQELPKEIEDVMKRNELRICLDKVAASRLMDQQPGVAASDGCISSPSGPSC